MKPQGNYEADPEEGMDGMLMARVEWNDPTTVLGWAEVTPEMLAQHTATKCHSLGYLLFQDKEKIVLAGSVYIDGGKIHANEIQSYPLEAIVRMSILKKDH